MYSWPDFFFSFSFTFYKVVMVYTSHLYIATTYWILFSQDASIIIDVFMYRRHNWATPFFRGKYNEPLPRPPDWDSREKSREEQRKYQSLCFLDSKYVNNYRLTLSVRMKYNFLNSNLYKVQIYIYFYFHNNFWDFYCFFPRTVIRWVDVKRGLTLVQSIDS